MFRKFIFNLLIFILILPVFVSASDNSLVKVGNNYYDTLEEAILNASSTDVIMLISDVDLDKGLEINETVNLNLNGNDITAPERVFLVQGGTLNLSGKGAIKEEKPNYGAIMVKGSSDVDDKEYSVVTVGKDVSLEGWAGVFVSQDNNKSYGVVVNLAGKVNAVSDTSGGEGIGVYVNGNIKDDNNAPIVNILDGAEIVSNGNGLYIAGYSIFNIGKAYISGIESGIGMKAGVLNINGATVECNGEDKTPTDGYNNGIKASGVVFQIESNNGYAGNMVIDINSGNFNSKNSNVFYEYIGRGNSSLVDSIDISGGTFSSKALKNVFLVSNSFKGMHSKFISGGNYSSDPRDYLKSGYNAVLDNKLYNVVKSTMKEVSVNGNVSGSKGGNFLKWFIGCGLVGIVFIIVFKWNKILNLFRVK